MGERNRSEGWRHAKISGHKYEDILCAEINNRQNVALTNELEHIAGSNLTHADSSYGTSQLESILGDKTTSKADIQVIFQSGEKIGISVKKSTSGQVWITSLKRFVECCNYHNIHISDGAFWSLCALTGNTNGKTIREMAPNVRFSVLHKSGEFIEVRDNRLLAKTIAEFYPKNWEDLVEFLCGNYRFIVEIAFSLGLNATKDGIADVVYYRDGFLFRIDEIANLENVNRIGDKSQNKSTLWLPFGHLQVHRPTPQGKIKSGPFNLQFHHNLGRILENRVE